MKKIMSELPQLPPIQTKHLIKTKFRMDDKVYVKTGFYRDYVGTIKDIFVETFSDKDYLGNLIQKNKIIYLIVAENDGLQSQLYMTEDNLNKYKRFILF